MGDATNKERPSLRGPSVLEANPTENLRSLLDMVTSLVKTRTGSVLTRNTILKMDHFASGNNLFPPETWCVCVNV